MDIDRRTQQLASRLAYIQDIFGPRENASVALLKHRLEEFLANAPKCGMRELSLQAARLEELFSLLEGKLENELCPMDRVRIVRHPQRISLKDILENVYDNYSEIGGQDEWSIDPGMIIARATIARRMGKKTVHQPVMVIGQEKGHGQEFRNGGSIKPWGNANALYYMRVAEVENIPIHTYVFTPRGGSWMMRSMSPRRRLSSAVILSRSAQASMSSGVALVLRPPSMAAAPSGEMTE